MATSASFLIGMGGLLTFLYQDYRRATDPEYRRKEEEEWARRKGRKLPAKEGDKTAAVEGNEESVADENVSGADDKPEPTKKAAEAGEKAAEKVAKTAKTGGAKQAVRRRVVEEEDPFMGFVKGAVLGYCLASAVIAIVLYIMLTVGHDIETMMQAFLGQEFKIDWENTNNFFLALSLQKEFLVLKLAMAACLARPLQRYLKL